jgi:radical SAM protein with 4Fe4S-binding SPASM domain
MRFGELEQPLSMTEKTNIQPYLLGLPWAFDGAMGMEIAVPNRALWGREDGFLRVDLYPRVRPKVHERHFGFWDISLKDIRQERTLARLNLDKGTLELQKRHGGEVWRSAPGIRVPFDEPGHCVLHLSQWDTSLGAARMTRVEFFPVLLAVKSECESLDSPLKQIHIPVTDMCNLTCPMCPRNTDRYPAGASHMAEGVFEALLEEVPNVACVMIMALGEPLLYPHVVEVVSRCHEHLPVAGEVGITTNATLLNEAMARDLIEAGIGFLYASVDGATKATYERYRVGANFGLTCANIRRFAELVHECGSPCRTMMNFVMMDGNVEEIPAFVQLAAALGVGNVTLSYEHGRHSDELNTFGEARLGALLAQASQIGADLGVNVGTPPVSRSPVERCFCTERVLTSPDGRVYPCPMLQPGYNAEDRLVCFGNVLEKPLREIWDSESYREFRRGVLSGQFPEMCKNCGFKAFLTP